MELLLPLPWMASPPGWTFAAQPRTNRHGLVPTDYLEMMPATAHIPITPPAPPAAVSSADATPPVGMQPDLDGLHGLGLQPSLNDDGSVAADGVDAPPAREVSPTTASGGAMARAQARAKARQSNRPQPLAVSRGAEETDVDAVGAAMDDDGAGVFGPSAPAAAPPPAAPPAATSCLHLSDAGPQLASSMAPREKTPSSPLKRKHPPSPPPSAPSHTPSEPSEQASPLAPSSPIESSLYGGGGYAREASHSYDDEEEEEVAERGMAAAAPPSPCDAGSEPDEDEIAHAAAETTAAHMARQAAEAVHAAESAAASRAAEVAAASEAAWERLDAAGLAEQHGDGEEEVVAPQQIVAKGDGIALVADAGFVEDDWDEDDE